MTEDAQIPASPAESVQWIGVEKLVPSARNARTHSDEQVDQIAASIREWGWTVPVLMDEAGEMIAGHGRLMAAHKLGLTQVPAMTAEGWTEPQKRAYRIADNKLTDNAGWDTAMLRVEIEELQAAEFDTGLVGFTADEISNLGIAGSESESGWPDLSDGDREPFQQKTFTLHDDQAQIVDDAIMAARARREVDDGLNDNANGNAIALICREWLGAQND